jgi:predicted TIM-barrel fold metal-dependent hydrolase
VRYSIISADSHVIEPPDLWVKGLEAKYQPRAPHLVRDADSDRWVSADAVMPPVGALAGVARTIEEKGRGGRYETDVPTGGYDPDARLADMAKDGIDAEVLYPTVALRMFGMSDGDLQSAFFRAYNTWVAAYCANHPQHLKGIGLISMHDVGSAIAELRRSKELGLAGGLVLLEGSRFHEPHYEPFWAAAEALAMPIGMHVASGVTTRELTLVEHTVHSVHSQRVIAALVYSGLFDRHPALRLVSVEAEIGWAAHLIERMDLFYKTLKNVRKRELLCSALPSETFHRNICFTFMRDRSGILAREVIGLRNIMWSSDYPHHGSTWPHSREAIAQQMRGIPPDEARQIICENAATLYGFSTS